MVPRVRPWNGAKCLGPQGTSTTFKGELEKETIRVLTFGFFCYPISIVPCGRQWEFDRYR